MPPALDSVALLSLDGHPPLAYRLVRARRKSLTIIVHRDGRVEVRAPLRLAQREIEAFLHARSAWIRGKQVEFAAAPPTPQFISGEPVLFLGEPLVLQALTGRAMTWSEPGRLCLRLAEPDNAEQIKKRVHAWYKHQAERYLPERLDALWPRVAAWGLNKPSLRFRDMRSRWGSCSRDGRITLNIQLMKAPPECIDYVIAHELCHLREFNHGPGFYALQTELVPDWAERRARLNALGSLRTD